MTPRLFSASALSGLIAQRLVVARQRFLQASKSRSNDRQQVKGIEVVGMGAKDRPAMGFRLIKMASLV